MCIKKVAFGFEVFHHDQEVADRYVCIEYLKTRGPRLESWLMRMRPQSYTRLHYWNDLPGQIEWDEFGRRWQYPVHIFFTRGHLNSPRYTVRCKRCAGLVCDLKQTRLRSALRLRHVYTPISWLLSDHRRNEWMDAWMEMCKDWRIA